MITNSAYPTMTNHNMKTISTHLKNLRPGAEQKGMKGVGNGDWERSMPVCP